MTSPETVAHRRDHYGRRTAADPSRNRWSFAMTNPAADIASQRKPGPRERLTAIIDHHWLAQGPETGTALCTCGEWSFDARVGQHPLPVVGERFAPFSEHVADVVLDLTVTEYRAANTYDELLAVVREALVEWDQHGTDAALWVLHIKVRSALAALDAASKENPDAE